MTKQEIIEQLNPLLSIEELEAGFESQQDCIRWANKVAPLLKFDTKHYDDFQDRLRQINIIGLSQQLQGSNLNIMISTARQALVELENDISAPIADSQTNGLEKSRNSWLKPLVIAIAGGLVVAAISIFLLQPMKDSNSSQVKSIRNDMLGIIPESNVANKNQLPNNNESNNTKLSHKILSPIKYSRIAGVNDELLTDNYYKNKYGGFRVKYYCSKIGTTPQLQRVFYGYRFGVPNNHPSYKYIDWLKAQNRICDGEENLDEVDWASPQDYSVPDAITNIR